MPTHYNRKITVYLSEPQYELIERIAEAEGYNRAALLRVALAEFAQSKGFEMPGRTE